ncbi:RAD51-associated protein 1 [Thomomys bottae]
MVRPVRNRKPVNYSQTEDSESDDDFMPDRVPLNKKLKTGLKQPKQDSPKAKLKQLQRESAPLQENTPKKRVPLDDKIFQRGLEAALVLSAKELSTVSSNQASGDQSDEKHRVSETEAGRQSTILSADSSDLDQSPGEGNGRMPHLPGKRKAGCATGAPPARQKRVPSGDSDSASGSDAPTGEDGEESDFSESEDSEEDFTMTKRKAKAIKTKEVKVKSPPEKKEKKMKPKPSALLTSVAPSPAALRLDSQSSASKVALSPEAPRPPAQRCGPAAEIKRPAWVPPAPSGSSSSSRLTGGSARSPSQNLRLGLSRLARVKPLHPSATSSHPW